MRAARGAVFTFVTQLSVSISSTKLNNNTHLATDPLAEATLLQSTSRTAIHFPYTQLINLKLNKPHGQLDMEHDIEVDSATFSAIICQTTFSVQVFSLFQGVPNTKP